MKIYFYTVHGYSKHSSDDSWKADGVGTSSISVIYIKILENSTVLIKCEESYLKGQAELLSLSR